LVFYLCRHNLRDIKLDYYFLCENINLRISEYSIQIMVEIGIVEIIGMGGNARIIGTMFIVLYFSRNQAKGFNLDIDILSLELVSL
jgi:hypothetical protein